MKSTKNPPCNICKLPIYMNKDSYVQVVDYFIGTKCGEGFYHNKCYQDALRGSRDRQSDALKTMSFSLMKRVNKLLDRQGVEKEEGEVFEVV